MTPFDESTFRLILETALSRGDIVEPALLERVTSYLVAGSTREPRENTPVFKWSENERRIDSVLYCRENRHKTSYNPLSYSVLLLTYISPQTKQTYDTTDNEQY